MFAVIKTGGKQYRVVAEDILRVDRVEAEPGGVGNGLGERRHVAQAHVKALPGDRMDDVGGIADERDAIGDERARHRQPAREPPPRARPQVSEPLAQIRNSAHVPSQISWSHTNTNPSSPTAPTSSART